MSIARWNPPEALSFIERKFVKRMARTGKLFAFLREQRHAIFDDAFQDELAKIYRDTGAGGNRTSLLPAGALGPVHSPSWSRHQLSRRADTPWRRA